MIKLLLSAAGLTASAAVPVAIATTKDSNTRADHTIKLADIRKNVKLFQTNL